MTRALKARSGEDAPSDHGGGSAAAPSGERLGTGASRRRSIILLAATSLALGAAERLRPTEYLARQKPPLQLDRQIPRAFGTWREATFVTPVVPNPEMQTRLDALYTQVLARTYVDDKGRIAMLSIAYGSDQGSEATAVHRPEFCYVAQGFEVRTGPRVDVALAPGKSVLAQRLSTVQGERREPVMYWVTLDEEATLPGVGRKLSQLRFGLRGQIADGMLVRVSSIQFNDHEAHQFDLQQQFLRELYAAVDPSVRARYFGR